MSIGVLLRGFIGDMMDFGDVILYTLFPSFMTIQACTCLFQGHFEDVADECTKSRRAEEFWLQCRPSLPIQSWLRGTDQK